MSGYPTDDYVTPGGNGVGARSFFWDDELATLPPRPWLISGVLPLDADTELFGKWGSAKTFLALHLGACLATGRPFAGIPVTRAYVVFVAAEGFAGLPDRWRGWAAHHGITGRAGILFHHGAVNLLREGNVATFLDEVREILPVEIDKPVVFVFDTKTRCTPGGDEKDGKDSSLMLGNLERIREAFAGQCATLLLHHPGHGDQERGRGHSSEDGALDTTLRIEKAEKGLPARVVVRTKKQKDGPDDLALHFRLVPVRLDGDRLTGVIEDAEAPEAGPPPKHPRLQDRCERALVALVNAPGQRASFTTWQTDSKLRETTFRRGVFDLTTSGHVEHVDGLYEPTDVGLDYCEAHGLVRQTGMEG